MPMHDMNNSQHFTLPLAGKGEGEVDMIVACHAWHAILGGEDWQGCIPRAIDHGFNLGGMHRHSLTILLADNSRMHDLNRRFGKEDKATNVLAFPATRQQNQQNHTGYLGDIALGYEAVAAGAYDRGVAIFPHAVHLMVHGVLHLLGYDHQHESDASRMEALESDIMGAIGLPDPHMYAYTMRQVANHGR